MAAEMRVSPRSLVAGTPAKLKRDLTIEEINWKREGTLAYQQLSRRCLASLEEVAPLTEVDTERGRLKADHVHSLIETKRG